LLGYLNEGQRTNLCIKSQDYSYYEWTTYLGTHTFPVANLDPAGGTACAIVHYSADPRSVFYLNHYGNTSTDFVTMSIYVKSVLPTGFVGPLIVVSDVDYPGPDLPINSATWTRIVYTINVAGTNPKLALRTSQASPLQDVIVAFPQLEFAPTPSSYIPTDTVSVTRLADDLSYPYPAIAPALFSVYLEFPHGVENINNVWGIGFGQAGTLGVDPGRLLMAYNGSTTHTDGSIPVGAALYKCAHANGATASLALNGVLTSIPAGTYGGYSFGIGYWYPFVGTASLYGNIRNVKAWDVALTNAELIALTT
jgi:hypothetical protein